MPAKHRTGRLRYFLRYKIQHCGNTRGDFLVPITECRSFWKVIEYRGMLVPIAQDRSTEYRKFSLHLCPKRKIDRVSRKLYLRSYSRSEGTCSKKQSLETID